MQNLNQYNEEIFKPFFKSHEIYKKILRDYREENLYWEKFFPLSSKIPTINLNRDADTPREIYEEVFSMSSFYYLLPLLEKEYDTIYDLGCGKNMFKPYIPRLLGVGAEHASVIKWYNDVKDPSWPKITNIADFENLPEWIRDECAEVHKILFRNQGFYGDVHGFVDDQYINQHHTFFQVAFSICSMHFHPLDQFRKVVEDFASMIQPGGRGFIAINLIRMIEMTSPEIMSDLLETKKHYNKDLLDQYVRAQLDKIVGLEWLIVDVDLIFLDAGIDGNVRLVFEKK